MAVPERTAAVGGEGVVVKHRSITDPVLGITLTLGVNDGLARISWSSGACHVQEADLCLGRWTPAEFPDHPEPSPSIAVVCRATAIAVGAWLKEDLRAIVERLP